MTNYWRVYELETNDAELPFRSVLMEQDSMKWKILQTQIFEKSGVFYISVLFDTLEK